jgi:hypothetical protein
LAPSRIAIGLRLHKLFQNWFMVHSVLFSFAGRPWPLNILRFYCHLTFDQSRLQEEQLSFQVCERNRFMPLTYPMKFGVFPAFESLGLYRFFAGNQVH